MKYFKIFFQLWLFLEKRIKSDSDLNHFLGIKAAWWYYDCENCN